MARFKTFTNGPGTAGSATLLPGDLNSIQDDYEQAFSSWKESGFAANTKLDSTLASGVPLFLDRGDVGTNGSLPAADNANATEGAGARYIDPADRAAPGPGATPRAVKWRVRLTALVNSTAPATTLTVGLYSVSAPTGAGSGALSVTFSSVIAGTTAAIASPAANSMSTPALSSEFVLTAGWYVFGVQLAGAVAASSLVAIRAQLQYRQV